MGQVPFMISYCKGKLKAKQAGLHINFTFFFQVVSFVFFERGLFRFSVGGPREVGDRDGAGG